MAFLIKFNGTYLLANSGYSDQTPHSAASYLGLHGLSMFHQKDAMLTRVKKNQKNFVYFVAEKNLSLSFFLSEFVVL